MKLSDVISSDKTLAKLFECHPDKAAVGYKMAMLRKEVSGLVGPESEYDVARRGLFDRFGIKNEDGSITIPVERMSEYVKEMDGLLSIEHELHSPLLTLDDLDHTDCNLTPIEMGSILWLIQKP